LIVLSTTKPKKARSKGSKKLLKVLVKAAMKFGKKDIQNLTQYSLVCPRKSR
jgi:hypothetical protein